MTELRVRGALNALDASDVHAICLGYSSDVVRSGNGAGNGGLLFVIGQALPREVCAATLRYLKDDGRLDVSALRSGVNNIHEWDC